MKTEKLVATKGDTKDLLHKAAADFRADSIYNDVAGEAIEEAFTCGANWMAEYIGKCIAFMAENNVNTLCDDWLETRRK